MTPPEQPTLSENQDRERTNTESSHPASWLNFSCHPPSRRCRCCDWMEKRAFYTKGEKVPMKWHIAPQQQHAKWLWVSPPGQDNKTLKNGTDAKGGCTVFVGVQGQPRSGARGAAPCCGKAAISERGEISLCGDKPSAERTTPARVYKCALSS